MNILSRYFFLSALLFPIFAFCEDKTGYLSIEGSLVWQSKNDQRIPGDSGTQFSLADFNRGPFKSLRIYAGKIFNKKHEVRILYAPLALKNSGKFDKDVNFMGTTFTKGFGTNAYYKFNSYRLTYAYHFDMV